MSQFVELHPVKPQISLIEAIVSGMKAGGIIAYPTDSGYALGCKLGLHKPLERIRTIRQLPATHHFTLICRDLSEISRYAKVDTAIYRILKRCTPGGYTFILPATNLVPKMMQTAVKTVGIRIPEHQIPLAIAEVLGEALVTSTLILPHMESPLVYPEEVNDMVGKEVDIIIDGGYCGYESTSIIDLTERMPKVIREGSGDVSLFETRSKK